MAIKGRDKMAINVAKMYYNFDYSQQRIAEELKISRPSVSRLLHYAKEKNYVRINIYDPVEDMSNMENQLKEKFGLLDCCVASSTLNDEPEIKKYIGHKAAEYLDSVIRDGDIIGVGWGTTLYEMSTSLIPKSMRKIQVVQTEGGVSHSRHQNYAQEILENFTNNYSAVGQYLPLPVIFDNLAVKEMVDKDRHIKRILEIGRQSNIAIFSVGTVRDGALFFKMGYTDENENNRLKNEAVGDIYSRFIDADGNIIDKELDNRTVGLKLEYLRDKEHSILIAGGDAKIQAIRAALRGRYANVLITDQYTAHDLIDDVVSD